ncbi:LacI family DNA-binding transcriptional regulator [Candidatus Sumerlaeota bacterium]|nr:LacI family DNA-binding transcriptional regulator [Candidatus Sumerlaeota bacterium]
MVKRYDTKERKKSVLKNLSPSKKRSSITSYRVTIKDLARALHLAPSTISMALNDHPRISPETKKRVKTLARKMHYSPNVIARAMVRKRTHLIGVIISDIMSSFFPEIIQGIEDVVSEYFYSVILCATENNPARERHYLSLLKQKGVDGIIAQPLPGSKNLRYWQYLTRHKMPVLFILQRLPSDNTPYVIVDNYQGGYIATQHLIECGHRVIAHLAGPRHFKISQERRKGFIEALREAGLVVYESLIKRTRFNFKDGYKKTLELLHHRPRPTAIFACSDIVAIGAIHAIREQGLRVPQDVAIIGFDDLFFASFSEVPLSSIAQPKYEIGMRAAQKLLQLIEGEKVESEILKPSIVVRQSSNTC